MLERIFEVPGLPGFDIPAELQRLYAGDLGFEPGPRLYGNFVSSLDGVVELNRPGTSSGPALSARNEGDRFVMGLLRACAEVVVVGAGTLRAEPGHLWTAGYIYPPAAAAFAELRSRLGLPPDPPLCVVSRSGNLDRSDRVFQEQDVRVVRDLDHLPGGRALCEGGSHLFGQLIDQRRVDELFLTLSPLLAGRAGPGRLGMVEGVELLPERLVGATLLSTRRSGSHLLLRYSFTR